MPELGKEARYIPDRDQAYTILQMQGYPDDAIPGLVQAVGEEHFASTRSILSFDQALGYLAALYVPQPDKTR